jgi:hypothetical protein
MTYREIYQSFYKDSGLSINQETYNFISWLLKNYTVIKKDQSLPLKKEEKYDYYKDRWLW